MKKSSGVFQEGDMLLLDDFFKMKMEMDDEMCDFFQYMKKDKEQIEFFDIDLFGEEEEEEIGEEGIFEEDKGYLKSLDYIQEYKFWVELFFIQFDKGMVMIVSIVFGMDVKCYWQCIGLSKIIEDDYEVIFIVVLINKYQVKFSMEFVLAMLLVGKYSLVIIRAWKDVKEVKE